MYLALNKFLSTNMTLLYILIFRLLTSYKLEQALRKHKVAQSTQRFLLREKLGAQKCTDLGSKR
jgi:hypothetical protein